MLYYRDHIPYLEQFNINGENDDVDDATINIRNIYAMKMLLLFYPFCEHHEFPLFQDSWNFFVKIMKRDLFIRIHKDNAEFSRC